MTYPAYSEYKDSGNEWLGEIPIGWNIKPIKYVSQINSDVLNENTDNDYEFEYIDIGSVSSGGKIQKTEKMKFSSAPSRARRLVKNGDVIISTVRTYLRAIAPITEHAEKYVVSTGFCVVTPIGEIDPGYCSYMLQSPCFVETVVAGSVGVSYPATNASDIANIDVCLPTYEEQTQIAAFLDRETQKIDRLIEKQQQLIKLLQEKRQAVISHAVTKGLNPDVKMKGSGVEWLGEIPEHWEAKSLRFFGLCQNGINIGAECFGSGYPFISYGDVYNNRVLPLVGSGLVKSSDLDRERYSVKLGDVFFTRTSETIDEIGFSSACLGNIENATFAGFLIRFRPTTSHISIEYSKHYFGNILLRAFFVKEMNLVTRASLSQDLLKKLPVVIPPINEQLEIGEYLDAKLSTIDMLVKKAISAIVLMKERRIALISAAVTGKIDVRNIANG